MNAPFPHSPRPQQSGRLLCVLGPTNTGKTHLAVERMLGHSSGIIGLPLRLLAREIYDRAVKIKGSNLVALVTGEEKLVPKHARYFVCTVEAMPLEREYDFLAIDEIQLCADAERGHVFTERLLHARGRQETMLLGADTMKGLIRRLVPEAEFIARPRLSALEYAGAKKLSRLPPRSAVVAFSAPEVYALAELVRRQRGGAAVVLGALSPRARNAQVALFQNREVEVMVATDAIGMGLNLDIEHMAFADLAKFDGVGRRPLSAGEAGQIAGRAGRHLRNGTFGTTAGPGAECPEMTPDLIERIEQHRFEPVTAARWRNSDLDFRSLAALLGSLDAPPPREGLIRAREADDLLALKGLSLDEAIRRHAQSRDRLRLLWQVCGIPDFRKTLHDSHLRLLGQIFALLCDHEDRLPADWVAGQLKQIDRVEGDIDTLSQRLAHIRTWTYVAHRGNWLDDAAQWQEKTRAIEDRLSDALHERLTQRFVDRRTSALTRHLREKRALIAELREDDALMVEGETIGQLVGLRYRPAGSESGEEARALNAAAHQALGPALEERAKEIMALEDARFALAPEGAILLKDDAAHQHGVPLARLIKGPGPLEPRLALLADEALGAESRRLLTEKLQAWLNRALRADLSDLYRLREADLKGAARGIAYQLSDGFGAMTREELGDMLRGLDQNARHPLRRLGITFGEMHIFMPKLLKPKAAQQKILLWSLWNGRQPEAPPTPGLTSLDILEPRPDGWWLAAGFLKLGRRAYRLDIVQRIAEGARNAEQAAKQPPRRQEEKKEEEAKAEAAPLETGAELPAEAPAEISIESLPLPPETAQAASAETGAAETTAAEAAAEAKPAEAKPFFRPRGDGAFMAAVEWMNLAGSSAEELHQLLIALGYRPVQRKPEGGGEAATFYLRSGKAIQAKREREQQRRAADEAKIADSPFAALLKLKNKG